MSYPLLMAKPFAPNIDSKGRKVRAILGSIMLLAGIVVAFASVRVALAFWGCAAFMLFEATRGWCVVRACGMKTRV